MKLETKGIKIIGLSAAVPEKVIDNLDGVDEKKRKQLSKLIRVTGIKRRHSLEGTGKRLVDLATVAAEDAISKSDVNKEDIRVIIYVTQEPEFYGPSTAFYVQKALGVSKNCMAYDVNLGCSGYMAGLQIASSMLNTLDSEDAVALLINAERQTYQKRANENDKILFGDASTATLLKKVDQSSIMRAEYFSDGYNYHTIFRQEKNDYVEMDGDAVFQFTINEVSDSIKKFMEENNLNNDNIDYCVLHQAQKFIIDHIATNCGIDKTKLLFSLDEYGNTSGASVPLTICRNYDKLNDSNKLLLSAFGVGLAWGMVYLEIENKVVNKIIEV